MNQRKAILPILELGKQSLVNILRNASPEDMANLKNLVLNASINSFDVTDTLEAAFNEVTNG